MDEQLVVVVVSHGGIVLRVIERKTERAADIAIRMAIARQGLDDRYFTTAPVGQYAAGDAFADTE